MDISESDLILPEDFFPESVGACFTTRKGGASSEPYASLNLAKHVGDSVDLVEKNRQSLLRYLGVSQACWLNQVHKDAVVVAEASETQTADASWTEQADLACAIQMADCMPVLVSDQQGEKVGAAHAGWRGLCRGVIWNLLKTMKIEPSEAYIWLGPCVGQEAFEVGPEVREAFARSLLFNHIDLDRAFTPGQGDRLHADLQQLARMQLFSLGCTKIASDSACTYSNQERFFSFRRQATTGRMAALIWIKSA